jgi:hypothetical protein
VIGGVGAGAPGGGVAFAPGRGFGWGLACGTYADGTFGTGRGFLVKRSAGPSPLSLLFPTPCSGCSPSSQGSGAAFLRSHAGGMITAWIESAQASRAASRIAAITLRNDGESTMIGQGNWMRMTACVRSVKVARKTRSPEAL